MIVKLQRSIETTLDAQQVLAYDESGDVLYEAAITDDIAGRFDESGRRQYKTFEYAHVEGTLLVLDGRAPWQDW